MCRLMCKVPIPQPMSHLQGMQELLHRLSCAHAAMNAQCSLITCRFDLRHGGLLMAHHDLQDALQSGGGSVGEAILQEAVH